MMKKLMLLGAGAVGYVLGAKAGRERYEQIMDQAQKMRRNPTVQRSTETAMHAAKDAAHTATEKVKEKTGGGSMDSSPSSPPSPSSSAAAPAGFGRGDEAGSPSM